jgi:hypothetical protein
VQADARVGGTRPAGHEADARAAAELALCFGHEGRAAFLPAGNETNPVPVFVEAVEHREVTFAGNAEHGVHTLFYQRFDERVAAEAGRC